jgi:ketosteroid isomerase-like protein
MQSWLGGKLISYVMGRTRVGDIRPTLVLDHPDVQLTFPGQNSWSGVFRGRTAVERWLQRLVAAGVKTYPDQVVVTGPPWNSTVVVRGHGHKDGPDGERVYENRFVIWGRMSWGRLREYEVYEDTHLANELDAWLAEHEPSLPVAAPSF